VLELVVELENDRNEFLCMNKKFQSEKVKIDKKKIKN